ncbi:haloacid dehalogenase superfamily, subfamily IA, variant 3 with third motif having DD or ED/beta-phosphoglucomutase family hydrolase [Lutibacter oricola]|uniref:Haloacid dehalogenase superfamily, subfamily IA, variant 3 with third motif having DD or ED/beta-phosphoglucomutase family hydrolase n=1 Tax=Lutibacter oricola TaxID=762486 RepID=A0A1H3DDJ7_9FLAO|nr:beta-phosphoglucomutase family hydrolase [Lutibacter oricola]SDX63749.1 haloacid dehalogenase superfamily, subfamily IA, variant 3 with third motif having DD or ED/beta-phosphoglucomutase family hydrolase [Lutibacter oricola]
MVNFTAYLKIMIKIPSTAKALIFDLDGTLADTMQNHFQAWRRAVSPFGIDFTAELFLSLTGMSRWATIEKLNELYNTSMNVQEVGKLKGEYFHEVSHLTKEIEVVANVVRQYFGVLPMAIGTGSTGGGAKQTLDITNLKQYFDIVITSDDITKPKPHPETFLKCAELMSVDPKDCLIFEDGILGIQAAKTAGMQVIDINDYFKIEFKI